MRFTALLLFGALFFSPLVPAAAAQDLQAETADPVLDDNEVRDFRDYIDLNNSLCVGYAVSTEHQLVADWDSAANSQGVLAGKIVIDTLNGIDECNSEPEGCVAIHVVKHNLAADGSKFMLEIDFIQKKFTSISRHQIPCSFDNI